MIKFDQDSCRDLDSAGQREWIETNGLGGFASSTIAGLNTRRYHGLLVAATNPPVGRMVLLSKLEDALIIDGRRYDLSFNKYPGTIHPTGQQYLTEFRLDPFPIYTYSVGGVCLEKSIFMVYGENSVAVRYEVKGEDPLPGNCYLEVRPLIAFRDYHGTTHQNSSLNSDLEGGLDLVKIRPYPGLPTLHFAHNAPEMEANGSWYYNFEYPEERARGLDFKEDLFSPLVLRFDMNRQQDASIIASTEAHDISAIAALRGAEIQRREQVRRSSPCDEEFMTSLAAAADQYIVAREQDKTIIAGYHWFGDWGRDAMISLTGLSLVSGRPEVAKSILKEFARYADRGTASSFLTFSVSKTMESPRVSFVIAFGILQSPYLALDFVIEDQSVGANRIDEVLHHTLMLRVREISFERGPVRETYDQPVCVAFGTLREIHSA